MHAEAIATINAVEQACDTNALTYRGVCYWPLVRLRLWSALMQRMLVTNKSDEELHRNAPSWPDAPPVEARVMGPVTLGLIQPVAGAAAYTSNPRALFFLRPEEYRETSAQGAFAKIGDSVLEAAARRHAVAKVELADNRTMGFARMHPALFLNLGAAGADVRFDPPGTLNGVAELAVGLMKSGADYMLDLPGLTADMGKIFYFARIFEKLLRAQQPRALILSVYYHPVGMAWMLACRWAGVRSVDLQHGRLGPVHGLYTHLSAAPPDGYHLLPDVIWSWGQQTRVAIETTLNAGCTRHHAVIGGNPWLHKWRSGEAAAFEPPGLAAFLDETRGRPKILVSAQPHGNPLTPMMIKTIKQCPADWLWLFRLHPLRRHTAPQIAASLTAAGIGNAELDRATQFPLFTLLRYADHHITEFSSVTLEAAAFGLSTSLTAAGGEAAFSHEIAQGIARYTPDSASLTAHLHDVLSGQRPQVYSDFMDMSDGVVDRALDTVLQ